jgi:hypothetical protein
MTAQTFEVTSGAVRATDPCYGMDTWCAGTITDVVNGTWEVEVVRGDEDRPALQVLRHESASNLPEECIDEELPGDFGVDSGQFGFFDLAKFTEEHDADYDEPGSFYSEVCALTLPMDGKGGYSPQAEYTFRGYGVVTSSGYGDGSYPVYVARDAEDRVIAMMVQFMWDEDEVEEAA